MSGAIIRNTAPFSNGDVVVLYDRRRRRYRLKLSIGANYHTHMGPLAHDDIIGQSEGCFVSTNKGNRLLVFRPTLLEAVLDIPRHSQVIYPKDLGAILIRGDIYPGAKVLEVGLGSGAMTVALLRAVGPNGEVISYEIRGDTIKGALKNITELSPDATNHTAVLRNPITEGIQESHLDRIVLDIPEPWELVEEAAKALRPGGVLLCYLPTILQVHQLGITLQREPRFHLMDTIEVLERPWHVTVRSVRPDHRMVAHTGFITTARRGDAGQSTQESESELQGDD